MSTPRELDEATERGRSIVVYDGTCGFCRAQVSRLRRWDTGGKLAFAARQLEALDEKYPQLAEEDFNTGMRLIESDGTIHVGADALHRMATRLPGWRWIAWLYRVPGLRWVARRIYAWIARHRYRFSESCEDGACELRARDERVG